MTTTTHVRIPDDLAAVRDCPTVAAGEQVLILEGDTRLGLEGHVVTVDATDLPSDGHVIRVRFGDELRLAISWLRVGSVDGGPRPEVGQRVLVRTGEEGETALIGVVEDTSLAAPRVRVADWPNPDGNYATWWALLP